MSAEPEAQTVGWHALLGGLLRVLRAKTDLSLAEAAKKLGCTKAHLWDLESGRARNPTMTLLARIVVVYEADPRLLIGCAMTPDERGDLWPDVEWPDARKRQPKAVQCPRCQMMRCPVMNREYACMAVDCPPLPPNAR